LCLPMPLAEQFVQKLGTGAAVVGITTTNPQILLVDQTQPQTETPLVLNKGFKHF